MRHFWLALALCAAIQTAGANESAWQGVVTHVSDGDTLWVVPEGRSKKVKVRIKGIDAPELCQTWGVQSREALRTRLLGQVVQVHGSEHDKYGRTLGQVVWQQQDVGAWMVRQGHAWSYRFQEKAGLYDAQQHEAQTQQVGLYADPKAVRPQWFRKRHGPCQPGSRDAARE